MTNSLKIISWNVHYPSFAMNSAFVTKTLEDAEAYDVICLQEYVQGASSTLRDWLIHNQYSISYLPFAHQGKFSQGVMTATKKSLKAKVQPITLRTDEPKRLRPFKNIRGLLDARIQLGAKEVSIMNTHLTYARLHTRDMRRREFKELISYLSDLKAKHPLFLCGDFNFVGNDKRKTYLTNNFRSFTGDKSNKTWQHLPKYSPIRANLDYFFWSSTLQVNAQLGTINVSDHKPMTAEIVQPSR